MEVLSSVHRSKVRFKIPLGNRKAFTVSYRERKLPAVDISSFTAKLLPKIDARFDSHARRVRTTSQSWPKSMNRIGTQRDLEATTSFSMSCQTSPRLKVKCTIFESAGRSRDVPPGGRANTDSAPPSST